MYQVIYKTWLFIFVRVIVYLLLTLIQCLLVYILYQFSSTFPIFTPLIVQPCLILLGVSVSCIFYKYIVVPLMYILSLIHVIGVTTVILEVDYKGSLFIYSLIEYKKYFLSLTVSSVVSISTVKLLANIKDNIFRKDILPKFKKPNNKFYKFMVGLFTSDIRLLVDMLDELIVSYLWFTSYMYVNCNEGKKITSRIQSKFFLESIGFIFKVFPNLLIDSLGYNILFYLIKFILFFLIAYLILILTNFHWLSFIFIFIFNQLITSLVLHTFIYSFRICAVIYSFYKNLNNIKESINLDFKEIINKVPSLLKFAKKTKMEEFKEFQVTENSNSSLIDVNSLYNGIYKEVNRVIKYFLIKEEDILKVPIKQEDVGVSNESEGVDNKEEVINSTAKEVSSSAPEVDSKSNFNIIQDNEDDVIINPFKKYSNLDKDR